MKVSNAEVFTSRNVMFQCNPSVSDEKFDLLFDALPEKFWDNDHLEKYLGTLMIGAADRIITVGGWPWWVPPFMARRAIANVAAKHGVSGFAVYQVERCVLEDYYTEPGKEIGA